MAAARKRPAKRKTAKKKAAKKAYGKRIKVRRGTSSTGPRRA